MPQVRRWASSVSSTKVHRVDDVLGHGQYHWTEVIRQ
jgi:hypothetical protein